MEAAYSVVKNNHKRAPKELISHLGEGEKLGLMQTNDEMEEADAVISALQKKLSLKKEILVTLQFYIGQIPSLEL